MTRHVACDLVGFKFTRVVSTVLLSVMVVVREISRNLFPIEFVLQCITQCSLNWGGGHRIGSLFTSLLPEIDKRDLSRTKF